MTPLSEKPEPSLHGNRTVSFLVRAKWLPDLLVVLAAGLLCAPFMQSVWGIGDEGIWLHAVDRMMDGQILYRDFFEFHPPLGFLILYGWTGMFGSSLLAARALVMGTVAMTAWLTYACCRTMTGRSGLSALLALAWVAASQGDWTQVNHHWFTSLFSMIALWALLLPAGGKGRPFLAGMAVSAATLITTHRGGMVVLAGLVAMLLRRSFKAFLAYCLGGMLLLIATLAFLWWQGTLAQAFDQVLLYPVRHYSNIQGVSFGAFSSPQQYLLVALFPAIAALLALAIHRHGLALLRRPEWSTALLFAAAGLWGCFPRPDAVHIAFCAALALPLLAGLIDDAVPAGRTVPVLTLCVGVALLVTLWPWFLSARNIASAPLVDSHAGRLAIARADGTHELLVRLAQLPATDSVFFYPYDPMLAYVSHRRHPARYDVLLPEYSPPDQYADSCLDMMRRAQWVVVDIRAVSPAFFRAFFPALRNPSPPEKLSFEAALEQGFFEDARYGNFRLLRRAAARDALCAGIAHEAKLASWRPRQDSNLRPFA